MWHAREPRSIIEAAEKAAAAGNYASAENLLRDAARLQEDSLGPFHPDLANTLNNLGVVCEITKKPADAEQYFRRAYSIAIASLAPDHPFVTTSRKNLSDFCEARGKPVELPTPPPTAPASVTTAPPSVTKEPISTPQLPASAQKVTAAPEAKAAAPARPERESRAVPAEDPEISSTKIFTRFAFGALGPIAMLMVVLAAGLPRLGSPPELARPSSVIASESRPAVAPPQAPVDHEPAPAAEEPTTVAEPDADEKSPSAVAPAISVTPASAPTPATPAASTPAQLAVVRASLCGDLDDWSCDPADRPVPPGPLFFYTQVKSTTPTTIQHRWYQDNRLLQSVELRIQATRAGYRAYSRNVMKSESAGNWRVELRSGDGVLLHEERFIVR